MVSRVNQVDGRGYVVETGPSLGALLLQMPQGDEEFERLSLMPREFPGF